MPLPVALRTTAHRQPTGFRVQGSGFRVQGSGFRVQGSGFRVQGSGFRIYRCRCTVSDTGLLSSQLRKRVLGLNSNDLGFKGLVCRRLLVHSIRFRSRS